MKKLQLIALSELTDIFVSLKNGYPTTMGIKEIEAFNKAEAIITALMQSLIEEKP